MSRPSVTVGIPVYNGGADLERTIRSAMAQPVEDLEILVVDNASTDNTQELCLQLAADDRRVRYVRNETNIGQNGNFTKVYELASGDWLRWLGTGDTLAPDFVTSCLDALDDSPEATVVTTVIEYILDDGTRRVGSYDGSRPTRADPLDRLNTMLVFLTGDPFWMDPIYSLIRRDALRGSRLVSPLRFSDEVVACELALQGPFVHVDKVLATRSWATPPQRTAALRSASGTGNNRFIDVPKAALQRPLMMWDVMGAVGRIPGVSLGQRVRGYLLMVVYTGRLVRRRIRGRLSRRRAESARG